MYNWRLLLLAFFAVFQPIATYTERNLVDGRQQCCDHRLSRETTYSLYGDSSFKSEGSRINDPRRDIREVRRDEWRNENFLASRPPIDTFRERENSKSPVLRARYFRTDLHRERKSRVEVRNDFENPEQRERNFRVLSSFTGRIRSSENSRDSRIIRTDGRRIFRTRNDNEKLDQRSLERRTIDSRRESRLMSDNVDEVRRTRDIRYTREELWRTRDNTIRTDTLRSLNYHHIQRDVLQDRQDAATRLVLSHQRSVRSHQDISRESNDDRRLSPVSFSIKKQERENRAAKTRARDEVRNEAERRNIEILRQRSDVNREIGSRFSTKRSVRSLDRFSRGHNDIKLSLEIVSIAQQERENRDIKAKERDYVRTEAEPRGFEKPVRARSDIDRETSFRFLPTRQTIIRTQSRIPSLDRLSRGSSNERRLSFENYGITKQERENRDMRVRLARDEVRNGAEQRNIEKLIRERSEPSRKIDSRFSETRLAVLRNQRSVRSLDRHLRTSIDGKNNRIAQQEREIRDVRARDDIRIEAERRNTENRIRSKVDREIGSRFSLSRQADNNRERRLSMDSTRRNNELRVSVNILDRVNQITSERKDDDGYRSDQRVSQLAALTRMDVARTPLDGRITNQKRIREDPLKIARDDVRGVSLKNRRSREMAQWRLIESRLFDNSLAHPSFNTREKEINENRRTVDDRAHERMQKQRVQLREISGTVERENVLRLQNKNYDERQQRDENRASRGRTVERRSIRERINLERDAREGHQRVNEIRKSRFRDSENRLRATTESKLSSRIIEREISQTRGNMRNVERMNTRDVDGKKKFTRNVIVSKTTERHNIDIRAKSNEDFARDYRNTFTHKRDENETSYENNWQNLIYTMQGIYLCSIFIPMLLGNSDKKKAKTLGLWTPFQKLIKTD